MQSENYSSPTLSTNKRKRDSSDQADGGRAPRSQEVNGEGRQRTNDDGMSQIQQQLLQQLGQNGDSTPDDENQRTAQAALNTPMQQGNYPAPDASFDSASSAHYGLSFPDGTDMTPSTASQLQAAREVTMSANKPAVGTTEWHVQRKSNHKEGETPPLPPGFPPPSYLTFYPVERRRRETINEGINEIAKIVPGCEKNKGSILQRAVSYITELTTKERSWNNERATIDVAIKELSERNNKMKVSVDQAWKERDKWMKRCRDAGLEFEDYDLDVGEGEGLQGE
jgi:transcriptional regulator CBF1